MRMDVEYLAPEPGTMNIHHDALNAPNLQNPVYRDAVATVRLANSGRWEKATFDITNATFRNSQNGGADFRFEVIPPDMYVRRVTVRRDNP